MDTITGDWHGFHRSLTSGTHEIVILHDDKSLKGKGNKRKFVYSNAYKIKNKKPKYKNTIPVYDDYAKMFSSCDQFNKDLHGRTWPYKHGGRDRKGDEGHQDNFAWSSILENIYHIYIYTNNINPQNLSFEDFFVSLADELFSDAQNYE